MKNKLTTSLLLILLLSSLSIAQTPASGATGVSLSGTSLSWSAVGGATTYRVTTTPSVTGSPFTILAPTVTQALPTLSPNTSYSWLLESSPDGTTWTTVATYTFTTITAAPTLASPANAATGVAISGTSLTWNAVTGANRYLVTIAGVTGSPFTVTAPAVTQALPTLAPGTSYSWSVQSSNDGGTNWSVASSSRSFTTDNNFLTSVGVPTQNNYAVGVSVLPVFTWQHTLGHTNYDLELSTNGSSWTALTTATTLNSYTVVAPNQLTSNRKYYWRVKDNNTGNYSSTWEFTTFNARVIISSYIPYGTSANIAWYLTPSSDNVKYDLYLSTNGGTTWTNPTGSTDLTDGFLTLTGLTPGQAYSVMVRAKNSAGDVIMNYSSSVSFSTDGLPIPNLSYPTGGVQVYTNPPSLYWYIGATISSVVYEVRYYRTGYGPGMPSSAVTPDVDKGYFTTSDASLNTTLSPSLTPGATYNWQVRAKLGSVFSPQWSQIATFKIYSSTPGGTAPTPTLSWPIGGATSYLNPPTLYWYTGTYVTDLYFQVQWNTTNTWTAPTNYEVSADIPANLYYNMPIELSPNTYYWRVVAKIGSGGTWGTPSASTSFVIPAPAAASISTPNPSSPSGLITTLDPTFVWTVSGSGATNFQVRISPYSSYDSNGKLNHITAKNSDGFATGTSQVKSAIFTGGNALTLVAGATYYWQVQAGNGVSPTATSNWSYIASFSTAAGAASIQPIAGSPNFGQAINSTTAVLSWRLPTKSSSHLTYDVEYAKTSDFKNSTAVKDLNDPITSVQGLDANSTYYWRVVSKNDENKSKSLYSETGSFNTGKVVTAVEKESLPVEYSLDQNYPNPFNPTTMINFSIPNNSTVTLKVFDMLGREVKTLVNNEVIAGKHSIQWMGDDNFGSKVATGVYVYRITAGNFVSSKKMMLIK